MLSKKALHSSLASLRASVQPKAKPSGMLGHSMSSYLEFMGEELLPIQPYIIVCSRLRRQQLSNVIGILLCILVLWPVLIGGW